MISPGLVLDTDCLLAYSAGDTPEVGRRIAQRANSAEAVLIPVLCLAEAYKHVKRDRLELLDLVQTLENVEVTPVEHDMPQFLGGFSRTVGRMDIAQVAITAAEHYVPIMTSERHLVTRLLAEEWPIFEL